MGRDGVAPNERLHPMRAPTSSRIGHAMTHRPVLWLFAPLFAALAAFNISAGTRQNSYKEELQAMAGTWLPVSAVNNGYQASAQDLEGTIWTRDGYGKWTMSRHGKAVVFWAVKMIDATKAPKTIDIEVEDGPYRGIVYKGIYELQRDTLRICFSLPDKNIRPTMFSAASGTINACSEFRRVN